MRITLLTIGSLKTSWLKEAEQFFVERIGHDSSFQLIELLASKQKEPVKQKEEECSRILEKLDKLDGSVWVLDETGKGYTSQQFAEEVMQASDTGQSLIFVLGGAFGLTDAVRAKADKVLQLSMMTFPHELCRIVFLEQLYRALQIKKGSGYHH